MDGNCDQERDSLRGATEMAQDWVPNELGIFFCFSGSPPLSLG